MQRSSESRWAQPTSTAFLGNHGLGEGVGVMAGTAGGQAGAELSQLHSSFFTLFQHNLFVS